MKTNLILCLFGLTTILANNAIGQDIIRSGGRAAVVPSHTTIQPHVGHTINGVGVGTPIHGTPYITSPYVPQPTVVSPYIHSPHISSPHISSPHYVSPPMYDQFGNPIGAAIVTSNQFNGINQTTGGVNTINSQIDHSAFQVGRDESQFNGSYRFVRRPVYNTMGQVIGYQEGHVWNNNITGQEHGNLNSFTPNQSGGVHNGQIMRSGAGVHTQQHAYSRED